MTHESPNRDAGVIEAHIDPPANRDAGRDTDAQAGVIAPLSIQGGTPAWVSMEVYARQNARLCELEARLQDLENKLDSAIMTLTRTFGSGQAALQKLNQ